VAPATAAPLGYTGTVETGPDWPDKHLALMVVGESYEDSLQAPYDFDIRDHGVAFDAEGLPAGLSLATVGNRTLRVYGTPTSSDALALTITWYGTEGDKATLSFTGTVESATSPTITTLSTADFARPSAISLSASVVGNPATADALTGTVEFYSGATLIGSGTLGSGGVATANGVITGAAAGTFATITAKYLGNASYDSSTSAGTSVLLYTSTATGVAQRNGQPSSGVVVALLSTSGSTIVDSVTTGSDGAFTLDPGAITSRGLAESLYYVRATYPDGAVTHFVSGGAADTGMDDATSVGPATLWHTTLTINHSVAPVWTDTTLATPRQASAYSGSVAASSPTAVSYTVTSGFLPNGLSLDDETGEVSGTPDCALLARGVARGASSGADPCDYDFTITASNGFGSVSHQFQGTLLPAGIAPTWTDSSLGDFEVGTTVTDGVAAAGDPTIVYSVTTGTLPAGLSLSSTSGAISGVPTTAGPYEFTITASNDYGSVTADFDGDVAAKPEISLTLDFAAGTRLEDASSTIGADGLKVGSTYTLTMHSTPVVLYTGIIGPTGGFTWNVALPANTPAGAHRLVLSGIAPDGSTMTATAWFSLLADGTIGAVSYTGPVAYGSPLALAVTGADASMPLALGSGLLVLGGIMLLSTRRKRRA
jgi:LPXTG-motif cell wall-anchored protein